jgi:hypothetical protein
MRPSSGVNVILDAWRLINLGTHELVARVITVRCNECLRPIRWWNRRVWLVANERCAHLHCFNGQLFLRALVADEIRRSQVIAGDFPPSTVTRSEPIANASADNELRNPDSPIITLEEPVEQLELDAQQRQIDELSTKAPVDANQPRDNPSLRELGQDLWHFLGRLAPLLGRLAPHRPPRPPRFCMLCGGVEFSETSVFCSKCGTSLRP